MSNSKEKKLW